MSKVLEIVERIERDAAMAIKEIAEDPKVRYHAIRNSTVRTLRRELDINPHGRAPHQVFVLSHRYGKEICDTLSSADNWEEGRKFLLISVKKLIRRKEEGLL